MSVAHILGQKEISNDAIYAVLNMRMDEKIKENNGRKRRLKNDTWTITTRDIRSEREISRSLRGKVTLYGRSRRC